LIYGLLIGLLIYLSYSTKSIGVILIPSLLIYDRIKFHRITRFSISISLLFVILMTLQTIFFHSDSEYWDIFSVNHTMIFRNLFSYVNEVVYVLWDDSNFGTIFLAISLITVFVLAIIYYMTRFFSVIRINLLQEYLTARSIF